MIWCCAPFTPRPLHPTRYALQFFALCASTSLCSEETNMAVACVMTCKIGLIRRHRKTIYGAPSRSLPTGTLKQSYATALCRKLSRSLHSNNKHLYFSPGVFPPICLRENRSNDSPTPVVGVGLSFFSDRVNIILKTSENHFKEVPLNSSTKEVPLSELPKKVTL